MRADKAKRPTYWMVSTSLTNFKFDRDHLGFKTQGFPTRYRKSVQEMKPGDRVVYYIVRISRFGAMAHIMGKPYHDEATLWPEGDQPWPERAPSEAEIVLDDHQLVDARKLINRLSFVKNKAKWFVQFQGSLRRIPENDFLLIESELRKASQTGKRLVIDQVIPVRKMAESEAIKRIETMELQSKGLHDRICEMLQIIGERQGCNAFVRHKIAPSHPHELDVAWLSAGNPEIAIEIQISGNITEAKERLTHAKKFNYRKVIIVIKKDQVQRLNDILKYDELRHWIDAWSIQTVLQLYESGTRFLDLMDVLKESSFKDRSEIPLV